MPLQDDVQIVSVDDHVIEHPGVFQDRLPEKFKERGPTIVHTPEGHDIWMYDGVPHPSQDGAVTHQELVCACGNTPIHGPLEQGKDL
jgi:hypothetical protein